MTAGQHVNERRSGAKRETRKQTKKRTVQTDNRQREDRQREERAFDFERALLCSMERASMMLSQLHALLLDASNRNGEELSAKEIGQLSKAASDLMRAGAEQLRMLSASRQVANSAKRSAQSEMDEKERIRLNEKMAEKARSILGLDEERPVNFPENGD